MKYIVILLLFLAQTTLAQTTTPTLSIDGREIINPVDPRVPKLNPQPIASNPDVIPRGQYSANPQKVRDLSPFSLFPVSPNNGPLYISYLTKNPRDRRETGFNILTVHLNHIYLELMLVGSVQQPSLPDFEHFLAIDIRFPERQYIVSSRQGIDLEIIIGPLWDVDTIPNELTGSNRYVSPWDWFYAKLKPLY